MVDTTDSKSVASNRVRVQVSSPVRTENVPNNSERFFCLTSQLRRQTCTEFVEFYGFGYVVLLDVFGTGDVCYGAGNFQA